MDLIAAEPLLASPVAVAYDEDGIGYVVEMRDYPYTDRKTHQAWKDNTTDAPIGRVRKLIDRDGDGVFDESHILADGLSWPTGICCWKGGVFVTATPDIWYLKDTDGDHRADVREKVFTGFRKYNVQAVINSPLWGLDNRITFAGGSNGGQVSSLKHPTISPLRVARNDLRIDPRRSRRLQAERALARAWTTGGIASCATSAIPRSTWCSMGPYPRAIRTCLCRIPSTTRGSRVTRCR
jgi:putative membrane-bound dehydrogenase-like protein